MARCYLGQDRSGDALMAEKAISCVFNVFVSALLIMCASILSYFIVQYNSTPYEIHWIKATNSVGVDNLPVVDQESVLHIKAERSHYRFCNARSHRYVLFKSTGAVVYRDEVVPISSTLMYREIGAIDFAIPDSLPDDVYIYRVVVTNDCGLRVFATPPHEIVFRLARQHDSSGVYFSPVMPSIKK